MKNILPVLAGVALVALVVGAVWWRRVMVDGLPPRTECADEASARALAQEFVAREGGLALDVLGTGSMSPYIPAARDGAAGRGTVVAVVVTRPGAQFADIRRGDLCVYRPHSAPAERWLHQAAQRDGHGWIMSGLANSRSESWMRMTADNWRGTVAHTFIW